MKKVNRKSRFFLTRLSFTEDERQNVPEVPVA